jgi:4-oxalomesaconate tautomerase
VATAALLPSGPASEVFEPHTDGVVVLEHPSGSFEAAIDLYDDNGTPVIRRAGIVRTARKLMDGMVFPREYR